MPRVVAFKDAKAKQTQRKETLRTPFLESSAQTPRLPVAFLSQGNPGRVIKPHFHAIDQFQVIAEGKGKFGRADIEPYCVHFSRAYTPYGPLLHDEKIGMSFLTLRARHDPGAQFFPDSKEKLRQVQGREPWQITRQISFPSAAAVSAVELQEVSGIRDDRGLAGYTLRMAPDSKALAPDPSNGDGQYLLIVKGSLWHDSAEKKALTVIFVEPKDGAFPLHAGAQGLEAIVLNFPQASGYAAVEIAPSSVAGFKKWQCELCAFAYDEALGMPEDGIAPGTRWQDVPDTWTCPDCATSKSDFRMVEVQ